MMCSRRHAPLCGDDAPRNLSGRSARRLGAPGGGRERSRVRPVRRLVDPVGSAFEASGVHDDVGERRREADDAVVVVASAGREDHCRR